MSMTGFQSLALTVTWVWLLAVAVRFRRSMSLLLAGLVGIGLLALAAVMTGRAAAHELGIIWPESWLATLGWAAPWTMLMLAYSPAADWLATRVFAAPPTLNAFRIIQKSLGALLGGIAIAWFLGGFLEELVFRGVVLGAVESGAASFVPQTLAASAAIVVAAIGAGIIHWYQGPRAMLIITQLSILFGVLFILSGHNLWAVILCHGCYDTIAFVRFASGKSRYAKLDREAAPAPPS
jgi:membrane protease YdiL (CAAX protease family)